MAISVAVLPMKRRVIVALTSAEYRVSLALESRTRESKGKVNLEVNVWIGEDVVCRMYSVAERKMIHGSCEFRPGRGIAMSTSLGSTSVIFSVGLRFNLHNNWQQFIDKFLHTYVGKIHWKAAKITFCSSYKCNPRYPFHKQYRHWVQHYQTHKSASENSNTLQKRFRDIHGSKVGKQMDN